MLVSIVLLCLCANLYFHEVKWRQRRGRGGRRRRRRDDMALTDGNTRGRTAWMNTRTNMTKKTRHTLTWNEPQRAEDSRTKTSNTWWFQWDKTVRLLVRCTHTLTVTHTRMMMSQSRNHDVLFEAINLPGDTRLEEAHSWRRLTAGGGTLR